MAQTEGHTRQPWRIPEAFLLVLGILLVGGFLYSIYPALSPFVFFGAVVFLLYSERHLPQIKRILWLVVILFLIWFFGALIGVLVPFLLSVLFTYLLNPVVEFLERKRISRWEAALLVIVCILGFLLISFALMVPVLIEQGGSIITGISKMVNGAVDYFKEGRLVQTLTSMGIPYDKARDVISKEIPSRVQEILTSILGGLLSFLSSIFVIVTRLLDVVIVIFVTYYLLKDYPKILAGIRRRLPAAHAHEIEEYATRTDEILGKYLRGTLLIAAIQGTGVFIGLTIIGVEFALVLGIMAGILNLIPYIGFYSSLAVSLIVATFGGGPLPVKLISIAALFVGLNLMETVVLGPKIIGPKVGLHPVALILALVIFGYFMGFVGLLLAVPLAAIIVMIVRIWEEKHGIPSTPDVETAPIKGE